MGDMTSGDVLQAAAGMMASLNAENERLKTLNAENERLKTLNAELVELLKRYRNETFIGHQPHMIVDKVDTALAKAEAQS